MGLRCVCNPGLSHRMELAGCGTGRMKEDISKEQHMGRKSLIALLALAATCASCSFQPADTRAGSAYSADAPVDEAAFRVLDIDRDGYISRLEARRGSNLERQFGELDTNRDGRLAREELRGTSLAPMPAAPVASGR
jgi:hypothetical protein